jgi:phosphoserine phosphatase RsbX
MNSPVGSSGGVAALGMLENPQVGSNGARALLQSGIYLMSGSVHARCAPRRRTATSEAGRCEGARMAFRLEFGVAGSLAYGQRLSGALEVAHYFYGGAGALLALIDGRQPGEAAATLVRRAADTLLQRPHEAPETLLARVHAELRGTRGVALALASIDLGQQRARWLAVGEMTGLLRRDLSADTLPVTPGRVGLGNLPVPAASAIPLAVKDSLLLATHGINVPAGLFAGLPAQECADGVIARHVPRDRDALVVVACAVPA